MILLSSREIAKITGIAHRQIRDWIAGGIMPGRVVRRTKKGQTRVYSAKDISALRLAIFLKKVREANNKYVEWAVKAYRNHLENIGEAGERHLLLAFGESDEHYLGSLFWCEPKAEAIQNHFAQRLEGFGLSTAEVNAANKRAADAVKESVIYDLTLLYRESCEAVNAEIDKFKVPEMSDFALTVGV